MATQIYNAEDGTKTAYRILGAEHKNSVPLVMITGLSATMIDWDPLTAELDKRQTVLLVDHRGIGESHVSPDWDEDLSLELLGRDVMRLVGSLGPHFKTINLLGWSMGGLITQVLLTLDDAKPASKGGIDLMGIHISRAILAATMTKLPRGDFHPKKMEPILQKASEASSKQEGKRLITTAMMEYQYDPDFLAKNDALFQQRVQAALDTRRPQSMIMLQSSAIASVNVSDRLSRVPSSLPVLIIHGKLDRMVAYAESDIIQGGIKHATRMQTPSDQYGHFWHDYFGADFWANSIDKFLNARDGQAKL